MRRATKRRTFGRALGVISVRHIGGSEMKPSTENRLKGKIHEVKGAIKEQAGRLRNNPDMEDEGTGEKIAGKVQKKIGQVQKVTEKF